MIQRVYINLSPCLMECCTKRPLPTPVTDLSFLYSPFSVLFSLSPFFFFFFFLFLFFFLKGKFLAERLVRGGHTVYAVDYLDDFSTAAADLGVQYVGRRNCFQYVPFPLFLLLLFLPTLFEHSLRNTM